jgi:hypothetical protein
MILLANSSEMIESTKMEHSVNSCPWPSWDPTFVLDYYPLISKIGYWEGAVNSSHLHADSRTFPSFSSLPPSAGAGPIIQVKLKRCVRTSSTTVNQVVFLLMSCKRGCDWLPCLGPVGLCTVLVEWRRCTVIQKTSDWIYWIVCRIFGCYCLLLYDIRNPRITSTFGSRMSWATEITTVLA